MKYFVILISIMFFNELSFAGLAPGHNCPNVFSGTKEKISQYRGAGAYFQIPPVYVQISKTHQEGKTVSPADLFHLLVQERNYESCNCKPKLHRQIFWGTLNRTRKVLSGLFGNEVSTSTWFKKRLGAELSRTKGDFDAIADIIRKERNRMIDGLESSIRADTRVAQINNEIFHLLESAWASGNESATMKLVKTHYDLTVKVLQLESEKIQIEHSGKPISEVERNAGGYREISVKLTHAIRGLRKIETAIGKISNRKVNFMTGHGPYEEELLRKWSTREKFQKDSQIALANLYVQLTRLQVLENMLEGDLSGIEGPVNQNYLGQLNKALEDHKVYLQHPEVFGDLYKNSPYGVKGLSDEKLPLERYNTTRDIANRWVSLWYRRIEEIEVRIQFNFAVANVSYEIFRFVMRNNLAGTKQTISEVGDKSWQLLKKIPQKIAELRNKKQLPRPEIDYSATQLAEVSDANSAFETLFELARQSDDDPKSLTQGQTTRNKIRDTLAVLEYYFENIEKYGEPIHPDIDKILSSAKAIDLHNWIISNANRNETGGPPYSLVVASKILQKQLESLTRYESLGADLIENLGAWSVGLTSAYYGVMPAVSSSATQVFKYTSHYFNGLF